jgi:Outer membrane protein Omp28/Secretion system C-terminal sorting domain
MRPALILCVLPVVLHAQTLVSTMPLDRTGLLEEFTAINCGNCPQGHSVAAGLIGAHGDDLVVVNVHGGVLANPSSGQPDFRTTFGTSIWDQFDVNAQPLGMLNRRPHNGNTVISPTQWGTATTNVLGLPSPVNVGLAAQFDADTRDLTVQVEAYWTANGTGGNDHVHVLLTESNIIGYQQDYVNGAQSAYSHQHVLRSFISPLWGDEVLNNTMGHLEQLGYTFNVPMDWNISNGHVVAYVGEYQGEVYQAAELDAADFSTGLDDAIAEMPVIRVYPNPANDAVVIEGPGATRTTLLIFDTQGRTIPVPSVFADGCFVVDVSDLIDGLYTVKVPNAVPVRLVVAH